jgi:hypothetical protein
MSAVGSRTKNEYAGEGQQQSTRPGLSNLRCKIIVFAIVFRLTEINQATNLKKFLDIFMWSFVREQKLKCFLLGCTREGQNSGRMLTED